MPPGRCSDRGRCKEGNSTTEPGLCARNILLAHALVSELARCSLLGPEWVSAWRWVRQQQRRAMHGARTGMFAHSKLMHKGGLCSQARRPPQQSASGCLCWAERGVAVCSTCSSHQTRCCTAGDSVAGLAASNSASVHWLLYPPPTITHTPPTHRRSLCSVSWCLMAASAWQPT